MAAGSKGSSVLPMINFSEHDRLLPTNVFWAGKLPWESMQTAAEYCSLQMRNRIQTGA